MADEKIEVIFGAQVGALIAGVERVKHEVDSVREPVDKLVEGFKGIAEATGIAFAAEKIAEWTEHVAEAAEKLINLSETFGTSADRLKEFQNIMTLAGGEGNNVTRVIIGLGRALEKELKDPLSTQRAGFETIFKGMAGGMEQLRAAAEDPLAVIDLLRQRFSALAPDFQRTEAFTQALGFRFYQLVPILKLNNEEYAKFKAEQAKTGADATGIKELEELGHKLNELHLAMEGFGKTFILSVVDPLKQGVEWITKFTESLTNALKATNTINGGTTPWLAGPGGGGRITPEEIDWALRKRQEESGGRYDILHGPGGKPSGTITDFSKFPDWEGFMGPAGKSRAAGAYGFQPGTYAEAAKITGLSDFSPGSQDVNAITWHRYHPEAWAASDRKGEGGVGKGAGGEGAAGAGEAGGGEAGKEKTGAVPDLKRDYETALHALHLQQEKVKDNFAEWEALEQKKFALMKQYEQDTSTEEAKEVAEQRRNAAEILAIKVGQFSTFEAFNKAQLASTKATLDQEVALGKISKSQETSDLAKMLADQHSEEDKALQTIIDTYATTTKEHEALNNKLIKLDADYEAKRAELEAKYTDEVTKENEKRLKIITDGFNTLGHSVTSAFNSLLLGQETWANASKKLFTDVGNFFLDTVEKMAAKWAASGLASAIGNAATQTAVSTAQSAGGSGLGELLSSLFGQLFGLTLTQTATTTVQTTAITTAIGASTTLIVGAIEQAAILQAVAPKPFGFARGGIVPSAAGGWSLPSFSGATPALLHSNEMVLPANISQGLQGAINAGSLGGGGGHTFNLNVSAMDGASVMKHGPAIVASINSALRNGASLRSNGSY